ncbi:MAG: hypothetical protein V4712_02480 [Pseudomonadota bacterium]
MMNRDAFARLVGETVMHFTPAANLAGIQELGLLRPIELGRRAEINLSELVLRQNRLDLRIGTVSASLNHQKPLRAAKSDDFIDQMSRAEWSSQLDQRLFFLPTKRKLDSAFSTSFGEQSYRLIFDSRRFYDAFAPDIFLSPINSGSATRFPARRGSWLYVPVAAGETAFRGNRVKRGLVKSPDAVVEISIRRDIGPDLLHRLRIYEWTQTQS